MRSPPPFYYRNTWHRGLVEHQIKDMEFCGGGRSFHKNSSFSANFAPIFKSMVLPIVAYGSPILRTLCKDISPDYPDLEGLIANMWETMYNSSGVGLAAPQVNKDIRLFVIDSTQIFANLDEEDKGKYPDEPGFKQVFINAHIRKLNGEPWSYNEGCLSIPKIREDVKRNEEVTIEYVDENFEPH